MGTFNLCSFKSLWICMTKDELKLALKHAKRDERHLSNAETRYWCNQYKLLATQAVEALAQPEHGWTPERIAGIARLKDAQDKRLAQPEQEPVAWMDEEMTCIFFDAERPEPFDFDFWKPLYATPPQRKPLSFEQVEDCFPEGAIFAEDDGWLRVSAQTLHDIARAIEAAHGIKGGA